MSCLWGQNFPFFGPETGDFNTQRVIVKEMALNRQILSFYKNCKISTNRFPVDS